MNPRTRPAVLVAALVLLLFALSTGGCSSFSVPSVDQLVSRYQTNRAHFAQIAGLASVDATFGVEVDKYGARGIDIKDKVVSRYSKALATIGATHVSASDHTLDVTLGSEGLAVSGAEWGYYYSTDSAEETVSLDVARSPDAPEMWLYPLGDGWYATVYRF